MPVDERRNYWSQGEIIRLVHVRDNRIWCALPVTVLADGPEATVIRISVGTKWVAAVNYESRRVHLDVEDWSLAEATWTGDNCTYVIRPGRWCATGWFEPAGGHEPGRFYINGQLPPKYLAQGITTLDLEVDAELSPPEYRVVWKDYELMRRACASGTISQSEELNTIASMLETMESLPGGHDGHLLRSLSTVSVPVAGLPMVALTAWSEIV